MALPPHQILWTISNSIWLWTSSETECFQSIELCSEHYSTANETNLQIIACFAGFCIQITGARYELYNWTKTILKNKCKCFASKYTSCLGYICNLCLWTFYHVTLLIIIHQTVGILQCFILYTNSTLKNCLILSMKNRAVVLSRLYLRSRLQMFRHFDDLVLKIVFQFRIYQLSLLKKLLTLQFTFVTFIATPSGRLRWIYSRKTSVVDPVSFFI